VTILLTVLNIMAGLFLVGVVLLQTGKGADMGAVFGGASSTVFGPGGGGSVLTKITVATAAVFMLTSLMLAVLSAREESVFSDFAEPAPIATPAPSPTPQTQAPAQVAPQAPAAVDESGGQP